MSQGRKHTLSASGKLFALAFGLFGLTLSTSIVGTYAWYKVRDFARVDQISMGFSGTANLQAGVRDENGEIEYKQVLNEDDFRKADPNYDTNIYLKDVSSMFSSSWLNGPEETKTPVLRQAYTKSLETTMTEPATEGFVQIETFFRADVPCHLYLSNDTRCRPIERFNRAIAAQYDYDEEELNRVLDCVRVSFYSDEGFYIAEPGQAEPSHTRFGGPLQAHNQEGFFDYEDGKEILYGEYEGEPAYLPALEEDSPEPEGKSAFNAKHKAGVAIVDPDSVAYAVEETIPLEDFYFQGGPTAGDAICLGTLSPNEDYRLVISVYIEGWDLDLTDTLAAGKFSLDLNFTGLMDI